VKRLGLVSLLALAWTDQASAQSVAQINADPGAARGGFATHVAAPPPPAATAIDPDTDPGRTLNTNVSQVGNVYTIDGGTRTGNNLFHSFASFDLAIGDIARWEHTTGDPNTVANVINRVTGGSPSSLFGTLDSTAIPNADFYFINPAGIVFGAEAQVNVPAAAYFSTASELRFATGPAFSVAAPDGSTLNVAAPEAFGFIGGEAAILVSGVDGDFVANQGAISFTASDVTIEDSSFAVGGLVAVAVGAGPAEVALDGTTADALSGTVDIFNAQVQSVSSADWNGAVNLAGGLVSLASSSDLAAAAGPGVDGGSFAITAPILQISDSFVGTTAAGDSAAGAVVITAGDFTVTNGAVYSQAEDQADTGAVDIAAINVSATDSTIATQSADGDSGSVILAADDVALTRTDVFTDSLGAGASGAVDVRGDSIDLDASFVGSNSQDGPSGLVSVVAGSTLVATDSSISSATFGAGQASDIFVSAADVQLSGSFIGSDPGAGSTGATGNVIVEAGTLTVNTSVISAATYGTADAGSVSIVADNVEIVDSQLNSSSFNVAEGPSPGSAGNISVDASGSLAIRNSTISSSGLCPTPGCTSGNAGNVDLAAADIEISAGSLIASDSIGQFGNAGNVVIAAGGQIFIRNAFLSSSATCLTAGCVNGSAGIISLAATDILGENANFTTDVGDFGFSGGIFLTALDRISLESGFLSANRGVVSMAAVGNLDLTGVTMFADSFGSGAAVGGEISLQGADVTIDSSFITTENFADGGAESFGLIDIAASGVLTIRNGTEISLDTFGGGDAGSLTLSGQAVRVEDSELTSSSTCFADGCVGGDAGDVSIGAAGELEIAGSVVTSDATCLGAGCFSGDAGLIALFGTDIRLADSDLTTDVGEGALSGGVIAVAGNDLTLERVFISSERGLISLAAGEDIGLFESSVLANNFSSGTEEGGAIFFDARNITLDSSSVRTENFTPAGVGLSSGLIAFEADETISLLNGSSISLDAFGDGAAGTMFLTAATVLMDLSAISSNAFGAGPGGGIQIQASDRVALSNSASIAASTFASGNAGFVDIQSPTVDLAGAAFISTETSGAGNAGVIDVDADSVTLSGSSFFSSSTTGSGDAGLILVAADSLTVANQAFITSSTNGTGDAGGVDLDVGDLLVTGFAAIASQTVGDDSGVGGFVNIVADNVIVEQNGFIDTSTFGTPLVGPGSPAGQLFIQAGTVTVRSGGDISSTTNGSGDAGSVVIVADRVSVQGAASRITTSTFRFGNAGQVIIDAGVVEVDGGSISSSANGLSFGRSGSLDITASESVSVTGGGEIATESANSNPAGLVRVAAPRVTVSGFGIEGGLPSPSRISSANIFGGPCAGTECGAGQVVVETLGDDAEGIFLLDGGTITTSSLEGPAGNIDLLMSPTSLLILQGREDPGVIETSSGPGTGGKIRIASPLAIISNGGRISALGQSGGANVSIDTRFFITSADRLNVIEVNGVLEFSNAISDVSAGTVDPDLDVVDASGVLRGQCSALRGTGQVSQLTVREVGPYPAAAPPPPRPEPDGSSPITGDCL